MDGARSGIGASGFDPNSKAAERLTKELDL
jgi:hypothetical protein